jgi:transposase-like protein
VSGDLEGAKHDYPRPSDAWELDEVFCTINGAQYDLGQAVDQGGHVLEILGQSHRANQA